jgi:CRISPR-associated endonuclease/helicase Cas3
MRIPHAATLDAWSLTSIADDWPLAADPAEYLHGLEREAPQVEIAWRAELDILFGAAGNTDAKALPGGEEIQRLFRYYPLRPQEIVREKPERAAELLLAIASRFQEAPFILLRRGRPPALGVSLPGEDVKVLAARFAGATLILSTTSGGLNANGMVEPPQADLRKHSPPCRDVADEQPPGRSRIFLERVANGAWTAKPLARTGAIELEPSRKWTEMRDRLARALGQTFIGRITLRKDDEEVAIKMLLLFAGREQKEPATGAPLTVRQHNSDVQRVVIGIAQKLGVQTDCAAALQSAGVCHDLGKGWDCGDGRWQRAIRNPDENESFAKSMSAGFNAKGLDGYRHEFGSLISALANNNLRELGDERRDLAVHLVASHHGRGRPHFDPRAICVPAAALHTSLKPVAIASRFDHLQRRFGHWGLAWLESLLMAADAEASQSGFARSDEDENAELEGAS